MGGLGHLNSPDEMGVSLQVPPVVLARPLVLQTRAQKSTAAGSATTWLTATHLRWAAPDAPPIWLVPQGYVTTSKRMTWVGRARTHIAVRDRCNDYVWRGGRRGGVVVAARTRRRPAARRTTVLLGHGMFESRYIG